MIRTGGLSKKYDGNVVLDKITLNIARGEKVALIGRNGSGKTTFFRCTLGLCRYTGTLSVAGSDPIGNREKVLQHIGYVPQIPPPLKITVMELIHLTAALSGIEEKEILDIAVKLGFDLKRNLKKRFVKLSGGMKQKILIAIALGRKPDLILMDEPSANLDPKSRGIFYTLLKECPEHTTIMVSSHRAEELTDFVTRVVEMDFGRIVRDEITVPSDDLSIQEARQW